MQYNSFTCFSVGHETEHWSVYRRYLEFYVLESKLTEFHGKYGYTCMSQVKSFSILLVV